MPNFKPYGLHWRPCGRIFKFCKFWRKKKEIEPFGVISENSLPKGFFWSNKKTSVISLLSADSRYFRTYALKSVTGLIKVNLTIISTRRVLLRETRSSSNKNVTLFVPKNVKQLHTRGVFHPCSENMERSSWWHWSFRNYFSQFIQGTPTQLL